MKVKLTVEQLLEDDASQCPFTGTVTIDTPPHSVRTKFAFQIGIPDLAKIDKGDTDDLKIQKASKLADIMSKGSELITQWVKECDLVHAEDQEVVLKTTEEFFSHPDTNDLVEALVMKFATNFAGGKKKPSAIS